MIELSFSSIVKICPAYVETPPLLGFIEKGGAFFRFFIFLKLF